jgi:hypothetical protein
VHFFIILGVEVASHTFELDVIKHVPMSMGFWEVPILPRMKQLILLGRPGISLLVQIKGVVHTSSSFSQRGSSARPSRIVWDVWERSDAYISNSR